MAVKILTSANFDAETSKGISLVDFWASWCGPCRMMAPVVEEFSGTANINVCKVNVDEEPALADRFSIDMIPALVFIKDGKEVRRLVGINSGESLAAAAEELAGK